MTRKLSVLLLGAGSMGGSLLKCWLDQQLIDAARSAVVDPMPSPDIVERAETYGLPLNPVTDAAYGLCVLAVKPQLLPAVIPSLDWPEIDKTLFVSIAAGKSIGTIRMHLKEVGAGSAPIVRVMPNLPVAVGRGISLLYTDETLDDEGRETATTLMQASGTAVWVDREEQIDSGMSISSCGPAYVFLLAEAMAEAGVSVGLPADLAENLARETIIGTGALMAQDERAAADLRAAVTSKGGTTAEALRILDSGAGFRPLLRDAVAAAVKRAQELSD